MVTYVEGRVKPVRFLLVVVDNCVRDVQPQLLILIAVLAERSLGQELVEVEVGACLSLVVVPIQEVNLLHSLYVGSPRHLLHLTRLFSNYFAALH